ncbi:hypothetical protein EMIT0P228_120063 [Pseudomonas brassicacearum]
MKQNLDFVLFDLAYGMITQPPNNDISSSLDNTWNFSKNRLAFI